MTRVKRAMSVLAVIACAGLLGWIAYPQNPEAPGEPKNPGTHQVAPDFALKDVDGRVVHLSDYKGKVVLLDFWATWCDPCQAEIPWFTEFERAYKTQGFAVLGVAMDDDGWPTVKPFLKQLAVNYRVVLGDDKTADQFGGIQALPTTYLIDRAGRVASEHVGLTSRKVFSDAIEQLLHDGAGVSASGSVSDGAKPEAHRFGSSNSNG